MRTKFLLFCTLVSLAVPTRARADISVDVFYDALDPFGEWIDVADYGYCWHPREVAADWKPYTVGEWVYTDAGWTWISEEPFGWATYHYGRWMRLAGHGWVWVPGTQWAPAWVSWRHNDRYTGWAPLPPESHVTVGISLGGWVDAYFDVGPTVYSFVEARNFGSRRLADVLIEPRRNLTIINETRNVTNVTVVNNIVINNGPDYGEISRRTERPIRRLRLEREDAAPTASAVASTRVEGDAVKIAAPRVTAAKAEAKPRKVTQRVARAEVDRGWQQAGAEAEAVRSKIKAEAKVPANLPPKITAKERIRKEAAETAAAKTAPASTDTSAAETLTPKPTKPSAETPEDVPVKPGLPPKPDPANPTTPPATPNPGKKLPEKPEPPKKPEPPSKPEPPTKPEPPAKPEPPKKPMPPTPEPPVKPGLPPKPEEPGKPVPPPTRPVPPSPLPVPPPDRTEKPEVLPPANPAPTPKERPQPIPRKETDPGKAQDDPAPRRNDRANPRSNDVPGATAPRTNARPENPRTNPKADPVRDPESGKKERKKQDE